MTSFKHFFTDFLKMISFFLYFWLHWVFDATWGLFPSCGEWGLLCCGAQTYGCGFPCGAKVLDCMGSVGVVRRL